VVNKIRNQKASRSSRARIVASITNDSRRDAFLCRSSPRLCPSTDILRCNRAHRGQAADADPAQRGAALALYALAGFTTGFIGPVVVGYVLDWFGGAASAAGWTAGYLVIAVGSAVAAWSVWCAPE
jgi:hypothetical protein